MRAPAGVEHVGDQHRVVEGADRDAVALQHQPVVFHVLADLEDGPVLQDRLQGGERVAHRHLARHEAAAEEVGIAAVLERDIGRASGLEGEGDAGEVGLHGIERGGLRVEGDDPALACFGQPEVQAVGTLIVS